ncbi:MAG: lysophospholipid acyltransferase family protein [Chlamydiales bacterium]|nr:lysophospholipid acyltransferase family protein [Chlamydiales bacterium]
MYRFVIACSRAYFSLFFRYRVYGIQNPYKRGAIIAPNHTSFFDPPIVSAAWPQEVHFLASDYLFRIPLFGALIKSLNSHSVARGNADLGAIKTVCELLGNGNKVIIFPEGRRSSDGKIAAIKPGIGLIVAKAKCAVIPTYVYGMYEAWSRNSKFPRLWGKAAVVFGTPILYEEFAQLDKKNAQQAVVARVEVALHALEKWYLDGAKGAPP